MLSFQMLSVWGACAQRGRRVGWKASPCPFPREVAHRVRYVLLAFRPASRQLILLSSADLWVLKCGVFCRWTSRMRPPQKERGLNMLPLDACLCVVWSRKERASGWGNYNFPTYVKCLSAFFFFFSKSAILIKYLILKSIFRQFSCLHPADCSSHSQSPLFFSSFPWLCTTVFCFLCKPFGIHLH